MKKKQRPGSLSSLADVLPAISKNLAIDQKVGELAFLGLWKSQVAGLCGQTAVDQSKAVRLKKQGQAQVLYVTVGHAAIASELGFQVELLKEALNRFAPQTGVTVDQIRFSVGQL